MTETASILGEMTEREHAALETLRHYAQSIGCGCRLQCEYVDREHPFITRLARQKERELLDLTVTQGGATTVEPREEPPKPAKPPVRRVAQRKDKVRLDKSYRRMLRGLEELR